MSKMRELPDDYECEHFNVLSRTTADGWTEDYCNDCGLIVDEYEDDIEDDYEEEDDEDDDVVPANETLGDPEE
jgi:hypothetical protein